MNLLKQRSSLRIISHSATSLLCVLLASVVAQKGSSNGLLKEKPSVVLQASKTLIMFPCPPSGRSISGSCPTTTDLQVPLTSTARGFNKELVYAYTVSGGRVVGEGSKVTWDLNEVWPGTYTATVEVHDNKKHALSSVMVKMENCSDCVIDDFPCPVLVIACYDQVKAGTLAVCTVRMSPASNLVTYEWSVTTSSGEDLSQRISKRSGSISIPTNGLVGQTVYVRVEVKGLDPSCGQTVSSSTVVKP
ncbi:MAG: hypothetical protein QOH71_71 [Blastocatellia bacterium]|nr:hypothetical protein [Blastocatellia bacterium]